MGINVIEGVLKPGTPVCIYNDAKLKLGIIESIESSKKPIPFARKETGNVAIKINDSESKISSR